MFTRKKVVHASIIALINALIFALAFLAANWMADRRMPATRAQFMNKDEAAFYRKYAEQLNHLREPQFLMHLAPEIKGAKTDFLYTRIGNGSKTVLIQGDSWAEQFVTSFGSYVALEGYADANDVTFVAAGVSSYAPSPMAVQYRLLKTDFGIRPSVVIAIIDQTDVADETCRYREQLAQDSHGNAIVRPYDSDDTQPYSVLPYLDQIDILDGDHSALVRLIKYKLKKLIPAKPAGCSYEQIVAPMKGKLTEEEREYFVARLQNYIDTVFDQADSAMRLIFVTHFYRGHVTGEYSGTVATLVKDTIGRSKFSSRIALVDFVPEDYGSARVDDIFQSDDLWSHLTNAAHRRTYARKILAKLSALMPN